MAIYLYQNEQTGEIKEIFQSMSEKHEYYEGDTKWLRLFTVPNSAINTIVDPFSEKSYLSSTENKKETIGTLQDRSKELSEKRKGKEGVDPNQQKYFDNYAKTRKGKEHPEVKKKKAIENLKKMGVTPEL